MAEVVTRTSKSGVLKDVAASASPAFDVRTPKGLTDILQAARQAGLTDEAYAAFRDTVLEYAQGGGTDQELQKKIESVSSSFVMKKVKVVEVPETPATPPKIERGEKAANVFGMMRPEPKFSASAPQKPVPKVEQRTETFVPPNLPIGDFAKKDNASVENVKRESAAAEPTLKAAVPQHVTPVPQSEKRPLLTVDQYKARISEIKRTVNAQVGNPIVLMDSKDGVGREYMSALLAAMKAVSGNAPGTLQSSMDRLEKAFTAVSNLGDAIFEKPEEPSASAPVEKEIPKVEEAESAVVVKKEERIEKPPLREPVPVKPVVKAEVQQRIPVPQKKEEPIRSAEVKTEPAKIKQRPSSAPIPPITAMSVAAKPVPEKVGDTSPAVVAGSKHNTKGVGRSGYDVTVPGDTDTPVPPIVRDDLHAPEIESGLEQLLFEWSLFRGSGLFGTGKGGREHPLFKKLAPLPMEMIIAGTWEGATKDVILSIRDYANGWRHEQGVAYVPSESFEMYLRRVIKRILKRQG